MLPIEIVRVKEEEIQFNRFESAFAVDEAGRILLDKAGAQFQVEFGPEEIQTLKGGRGVIFTHNHPRGWDYPTDDARHTGSSFSDADIAFACETEVSEMRVVTPTNRLFIRPPEAGWSGHYWENTLHPLCARHQMTPEVASARHWHEIWTRVARDVGLVYGQEQE